MSAPVDAAAAPAQAETIRAGLGIAVLRVALVPLVDRCGHSSNPARIAAATAAARSATPSFS